MYLTTTCAIYFYDSFVGPSSAEVLSYTSTIVSRTLSANVGTSS